MHKYNKMVSVSINKLIHKDSHRSLIKSTTPSCWGTLSSRILGLVRDVIIVAKLLGTDSGPTLFYFPRSPLSPGIWPAKGP